MTDIVRRLEEHDGHLGHLVEEAAAEIKQLTGGKTALQAEIERLRGLNDDQQAEIAKLEAECSEFKRHLIGRRGEIEKLKANIAHVGGFIEDMAARIASWRSIEMENSLNFNQAAADCRAMAASLQRILKP